MPYICERDFCIVLCLFVRTACVVYAVHVQTVQIQNLLQKSGLHEVPPKEEFNNIILYGIYRFGQFLTPSAKICISWLHSHVLFICLFLCFRC